MLPDIRQDSHTSAPPSIREELDRKVFEEIERLVSCLDHGTITQAQFDTGISVMWNCVSGLVSPAITETITEVGTHIKKDYSFLDSRSFIKDGAVVWITRTIGGSKVHINNRIPELSKPPLDFINELHPSKSAKERQDKLSEGLINNGWKRRS